jgi:predicted RNA binding protein YcfA (HicA-like mRNA interferase family)
MKFPVDAPQAKVRKALIKLGFVVVREGNHVIMERVNNDGTISSLVLPNHLRIKSSTLRSACTQADISRDDFLQAYSEV